MVEKRIKVQDILHGCEPGRLQSVGYMQVIPLVSELHDDRFVSPQMAKVSTNGYGNLVFKNEAGSPMIVPSHAAYIVDQAAQNHAMSTAGVVKAQKIKQYSNAMCVQQSQGGYIQPGNHTMLLLPFPLREKAHRVRKQVEFGKLWPAIAEFNREAGLTQYGGRGHLEYFFQHYKDQLDTFVAQFEPVNNQIGCIVLIGGKIVGVERTPNPTYFRSIWRALIRECYGSLALLEAKKGGGTPPVPKTRVALRKVVSFGDLKVALKEVIDAEYDKVSNLVNNILNVELKRETDESDSPYVVEALGESPFVGQLVRDGEKIVYASLIATEHWRQNEDWMMAKPFTMGRR